MTNKPVEKNTEQDVFDEVAEQYRFAKRYLDNVHERMNQQEELYRTYLDPEKTPTAARVFDPRIFRVIETVTPRMVANEPTGSFYPTEQGDSKTVQILNALMKYDWRRAEMFPKQVEFIKSMLIFGTAFGRVFWDFQEKDVKRMVPKKINGRMVWTPTNTENIKVTVSDSPNFEVLNIYDCFPDPNASNRHNMRWFIYRMFKTLKELKAENECRGMEYWKNLDKLEEAVRTKTENGNSNNVTTLGDNQYREHRRTMLSTQELHGQDESNPEFVVLRRFTTDGWVDIVPEHNVVIRETANPYFNQELPIIYGVDYPYPGELYGMGEIEPVDRIQRAINAVLNQRLDNVQLTLNSMWKVRKGGGVDTHTLISAPGNIIYTDDMDAVEPLQVPDVTGATFVQTMTYLTSALQNGSGVTDYTVGIGSNKTVGNDTATGTRLIQSEANAQFKLKIQLYNHMVIERIANLWKDLRIQYTTEKQMLRIIGADQIKYLKENTKLAQTGLDGQEIYPGDLDNKAKLEIGDDENFAFLTLLPEDIQPAIVGDYDFIAKPSSDQLNDPIAMQENFFGALDRISSKEWAAGLASQGKQINYVSATEKIFDKLQQGIEGKDMVIDMAPPPAPTQTDPQAQVPLNEEQMNQSLQQPIQSLETMKGMMGGQPIGGMENGQQTNPSPAIGA